MEKIKRFLISEQGKDILLIIIVILVGFISFELGRLSTNQKPEIKIGYKDSSYTNNTYSIEALAEYQKKTLQTEETSLKSFFASNKGKKYYPIGCSAGKTIKQENKIYFETKEEAENKGYELSGSCN